MAIYRAKDYVTDIDLLLIGKTGNGKSAVGNAILRNASFKTSSATSSKTKEMKWAVGEHNMTKIKVVDGPGVGDTRLDTKERVKKMHDWLTEAIMMNDRGYHAFLLVLKFGNRFTDEDKDVLEFLRATFGEDFVKNHCVLVMTHGDVFTGEKKRTGITFEGWLTQEGGDFLRLHKECEGRIVLFDNYAEDEQMNGQLEKLLSIVKNLGNRYTNKRFLEAAELRKVQIVQSEKPFLDGEVMEEISLITQALKKETNVSLTGDLNYNSRLEELSRRCELLIERVRENDRSTGVLKDLEVRVSSMKQSVEHANSVQKRMRQENDKRQREMEEMENEFKRSQANLEAKLQEEKEARRKAEKRILEVEEKIRKEREARENELEALKSTINSNKKELERRLLDEKRARRDAEQKAEETEQKVFQEREQMQKDLEEIQNLIKDHEAEYQKKLIEDAKARKAAEDKVLEVEDKSKKERASIMVQMDDLRSECEKNAAELQRAVDAKAKAENEAKKLSDHLGETAEKLQKLTDKHAKELSTWEKLGKFVVDLLGTVPPILQAAYGTPQR